MQKVPLDDVDYTVDHSAMPLLSGEEGELCAPTSCQEDAGRAMETIRRLMAGRDRTAVNAGGC